MVSTCHCAPSIRLFPRAAVMSMLDERCMKRVTTGATVGAAVGGAVGACGVAGSCMLAGAAQTDRCALSSRRRRGVWHLRGVSLQGTPATQTTRVCGLRWPRGGGVATVGHDWCALCAALRADSHARAMCAGLALRLLSAPLRLQVPGMLKVRYIGKTTTSSAAVFGLFLAAGSLLQCGRRR